MDDALATADQSTGATDQLAADADPVVASTLHAVAGIVLLTVSIGIFEAEMSLMFFDKSIDVTAELLVTFAAALLAPLAARLPGPERVVIATATLLAAAVAVATLVRIDRVELGASAVGIVAGTWWLALFASRGRPGRDSRLAHAMPLALGVILVLRTGLATLPLDEIPLPLAAVLDALIIGALLAGARLARDRTAGWTTTDPTGALRILAIPFILGLASDVGLNGAGIAGAGGLGIGLGGTATTELGLLAAGIGCAVGLVALVAPMPRGPVAAVALFGGALLLWGHLGYASLLGGGLLAFGLIVAGAAVGTTTRRAAGHPILVPVVLGLGWVSSVIVMLTYYTSIGSVATLALAVGVLCLASVAPPWSSLSARLREPSILRPAFTALAAVVLVLPAISVLATPTPAAAAPSSTTASPASGARPASIRLMAYNAHLGYSDGNVPSIPDIADVIAAASPDLVALEEVIRGSVIAGSHDLLGQLVHKLGMSYAFGPMFGDVEGVAVLSRLPIQSVQIVPLAQASQPRDLHRVGLIVRTASMTLVATHLGGADFVSEVQSILTAVQGISPIVVAGDLNSLPTTPQMALFAQAGFVDLGAAANAPTIPADAPNQRIDYFWAKGLTVHDMQTLVTTASDHRPIVADVSVP